MTARGHFEPDVNLMCDAAFGQFHCTQTDGHEGDHVTHGLWAVTSWPRMEHVEHELKTRARFAKEIRAAHADPHWLDES